MPERARAPGVRGAVPVDVDGPVADRFRAECGVLVFEPPAAGDVRRGRGGDAGRRPDGVRGDERPPTARVFGGADPPGAPRAWRGDRVSSPRATGAARTARVARSAACLRS